MQNLITAVHFDLSTFQVAALTTLTGGSASIRGGLHGDPTRGATVDAAAAEAAALGESEQVLAAAQCAADRRGGLRTSGEPECPWRRERWTN